MRASSFRDRFRFVNGVCPCCNRTFSNVARHMNTQHPDYDITKIELPGSGGTAKYRCSCGRAFDTPHGLAIHQGKNRRPGWSDPDASRYHAHLTRV